MCAQDLKYALSLIAQKSAETMLLSFSKEAELNSVAISDVMCAQDLKYALLLIAQKSAETMLLSCSKEGLISVNMI